MKNIVVRVLFDDFQLCCMKSFFDDYVREWSVFGSSMLGFLVISLLDYINIIFPPITTLLLFGALLLGFNELDTIREKEGSWTPHIIGMVIFLAIIGSGAFVDLVLLSD